MTDNMNNFSFTHNQPDVVSHTSPESLLRPIIKVDSPIHIIKNNSDPEKLLQINIKQPSKLNRKKPTKSYRLRKKKAKENLINSQKLKLSNIDNTNDSIFHNININKLRKKPRAKNGFSHTHTDLLRRVMFYAKLYIGSVLIESEITNMVEQSYKQADENYGAEEAATWGMEQFPDGIPATKIAEHLELLNSHNGDFTAMAKERLDSLHPNRLNKERIKTLRPNNPEINLLINLSEGMHILLDPDFVPNGHSSGTRPLIREKYRQTHLAVDFTLYKLVLLGLAFLLPMAVAQTIPNIHFSPAHWAPKKGKRYGRPIIDSTDSSSTQPVLNTPRVKVMADEACGVIKHPTLSDIINKFLTLKNKYPEKPWSEFEAWKMDLKGAFTLMSYPYDTCQLFSMELLNNTVVIFLCGLFGWSATPAYFQIITRAILFELEFKLLCVLMYVDDIMGLSLKVKGHNHRIITKTICCNLLGPEAIEDSKTEVTNESNNAIDMIGYKLNLSTQTVSISHRNALRAIYAFFSVDVERTVPVKALEIMASLASRYAAICPGLRPFVRALYGSYAGLSRNVSVVLDINAKRSIHMWRAMLCTLTLREKEFARPFTSFIPRNSRWIIQFDASLTGIGILLLKRNSDTTETVVGAAGTCIRQYGITKSDYQNSCEFIAALFGLCILIKWCVTNDEKLDTIEFRGDSEVALTWMDKLNSKSDLSTKACMILTLITTRLDITVSGCEHVFAEYNKICDDLSRDIPVIEACQYGTSDLLIPSFNNNDMVEELLILCTPNVGVVNESDSDHKRWWLQATTFITKLSHQQ